jgi:hypothetical protein
VSIDLGESSSRNSFDDSPLSPPSSVPPSGVAMVSPGQLDDHPQSQAIGKGQCHVDRTKNVPPAPTNLPSVGSCRSMFVGTNVTWQDITQHSACTSKETVIPLPGCLLSLPTNRVGLDYSPIRGSLSPTNPTQRPKPTSPNVESLIRDKHGLSLGNLGPTFGAQSELLSGPPHTNEIKNHLETLDESSPVVRVIENLVVNDGGEKLAVPEAHKHQRITGSKSIAP